MSHKIAPSYVGRQSPFLQVTEPEPPPEVRPDAPLFLSWDRGALFLPDFQLTVLFEDLIMALATLSPENRIASGLRLFECSARNFVEIARQLNIRTNTSALSEALNRKQLLDNSIAEQLLEILSRMADLRDAVDVPVDWSKTERIVTALTIRRIAQIAADEKDHSLDAAADTATKSVVQ
jgi:hypothetical protein